MPKIIATNPLPDPESDSDSDRPKKFRSLASIYKETDPSPELDDSELDDGPKKTRTLTDPSPDNKSKRQRVLNSPKSKGAASSTSSRLTRNSHQANLETLESSPRSQRANQNHRELTNKSKRQRVLNSPKSKGAASSTSSRLTRNSHQANLETLESTYEETNPSSDKNSGNSTTTRVLRSHSAKSKPASSFSDLSADKKSDKSERKGVHAGPKLNRGSAKSQRANPNSSKAASSSSSPRLTRLRQASLEILDSSNQTKRSEEMPRGPFNLMPASLNTDFAFMEGDSSHQTEKHEDMLEFYSNFSGSVIGNEKNEIDELNLNDLEDWWKRKESGGFDNEDPPSPSKGNSLN